MQPTFRVTKAEFFADLCNEALEKYKAKTGVDLQDRKYVHVQLLESCDLFVLETFLPIINKPVSSIDDADKPPVTLEREIYYM